MERRSESISLNMRRSSELGVLGLKRICCKQHTEFTVTLAFCWVPKMLITLTMFENHTVCRGEDLKPMLNHLDNIFHILNGLEYFNSFFSFAESPYVSLNCSHERKAWILLFPFISCSNWDLEHLIHFIL